MEVPKINLNYLNSNFGIIKVIIGLNYLPKY